MWINIVERGRPQMTIWRMSIACWVPKAINTPSEYVILVAFSLQKWKDDRACVLCYTSFACFLYTKFILGLHKNLSLETALILKILLQTLVPHIYTRMVKVRFPPLTCHD